MDTAKIRLQNEKDDYIDTSCDGILIKFDNLKPLDCFIDGPAGTPYEGARFQLEVKIGDDYPYSPPKVKFVTNIWHPAVDPQNGRVNLNDPSGWPVTSTIQSIMLTIRSWMTSIFDTNPLDYDIFYQALENRDVFNKTAEFWAIHYAGADKPIDRKCQEDVEKLTEILEDEDMAILQLSYGGWDIDNM